MMSLSNVQRMFITPYSCLVVSQYMRLLKAPKLNNLIQLSWSLEKFEENLVRITAKPQLQYNTAELENGPIRKHIFFC